MIYFVGNGELLESTLYQLSNIEECRLWLKTLSVVNLDTETEGFFDHKNKIVMLQLNYKNITYVIDVRTTNILPLKEELERLICVGQNIKFDYKFLKFHGIILTKVIDTFLNECILTNGLENRELGLGALALKYCNKKLNKSVRNQFTKLRGQPFTETQIVYGVEDTQCLSEILEKQQVELEKWQLLEVANLEYKATLALADIEYNGMLFNSEAWLRLADKAEVNIKAYEIELDNMVLEDPRLKRYVKPGIQLGMFDVVSRRISINWDSPTQMLKVFKTLGLQVETSGEKEIQKYQDEYPLVKRFIDYKKDSKLVSTYGKDFLRYINPQTKRIHGDFWQILDTFRVSCGGSKSKNKASVNLQNLPAKNEYLNCFIAPEGSKIVGIDYSGQEARIAASGSKDHLWVSTFLEGKDLHSEVCKMMFGITDDLVKTKPDFLRGKTYRDVAKTINFGVLFGMSKFKLSKTLMCSIEDADNLIKRYFKATRELKSYLDSCAAYGLKRGYIRSYKPYSGIRWFPQWKPNLDKNLDFKVIGEITRASYNTPVQASGALMTKLALVKIREYILKEKLQDKVKLIHVVHDAIYTEVKTEYSKEWSIIQKDIMRECGEEFIKTIPILSDITIEDYWTK